MKGELKELAQTFGQVGENYGRAFNSNIYGSGYDLFGTPTKHRKKRRS